MKARTSLREGGWRRERSWLPKDGSIRTSPTIRRSASSARAACAPARSAGHLRADHLRVAASTAASRRGQSGRGLPRFRVCRPAAPACEPARPGDPDGKGSHRGLARPSTRFVTTCAYCGVGCSFYGEMRGTEVVRMHALQGWRGANRGHSCEKKTLCLGRMRPTWNASSIR